jgi:hypothetical protein
MPEIGDIGGSSTVQEKMSLAEGAALDAGKELREVKELCVSPMTISLFRCTCLSFWVGLAVQIRQSI